MGSRSSTTEGPQRILPETVTAARVRRPHGVSGGVLVELLSDVPGRFLPGSRLLVMRDGHLQGTVRILARAPHPLGAVLHLEGYETRDRAEALRGAFLEVERFRVPRPPEGSYYHFELVGCRCYDRQAGALGKVVDLLEDGGGLLLVVENAGGRQLLVPFVREFLRQVDVERGRIDLALPPGLIEACESTS